MCRGGKTNIRRYELTISNKATEQKKTHNRTKNRQANIYVVTELHLRKTTLGNILLYYMASSASGLDDPNRAL